MGPVPFETGASSIREIEACHYDLIVTDMRMPYVSGFDIIASAKKSQPDTPVLVISGLAKIDPDIENALKMGALEVIPKPFESIEAIDQIIRRHIKPAHEKSKVF